MIQRTSASVKDANAAIPPIMNLIEPEHGVAVRLDPDARHGVVEDLVVLDDAQAAVVD